MAAEPTLQQPVRDPQQLRANQIQKILESAKQHGDSFTVKVHRQPMLMAGRADMILTFEGVTVQQIADAEKWLRLVAGGSGGPQSSFILEVKHSTHETLVVIEYVNVGCYEGPPRIDLRVTQSTVWPNNMVCTYPPLPQGGTYSVPQPPETPASRTADGGGLGQPVWPNGGWGNQGPQRPPGPTYDPRDAQIGELRAMVEREANARRAAEAKADLDRVTNQVKAEADAKIRAIEERHRQDNQRIEAQIAALKVEATKPTTPPPAGPTTAEVIKELATSLGPLIAAAMQANREDRFKQLEMQTSMQLKQMELQQAAAIESAKAQREIAAVQAQAAREQAAVQATNQKEMLALATKDANGSAAKTAEIFTGMAHGQMRLLTQMSELAQSGLFRGGEDEPPWVKGLHSVAQVFMGNKGEADDGQEYEQSVPMGNGGGNGGGNSNGQFNGPPPQQQPPQPTSVDEIVGHIHAYDDPRKVAEFVIALAKERDPALVQALMNVGGDFSVLFERRIGKWAKASQKNIDYTRALITEIFVFGVGTGVIPKEEATKLGIDVDAILAQRTAAEQTVEVEQERAPVRKYPKKRPIAEQPLEVEGEMEEEQVDESQTDLEQEEQEA